MGEITNPGLNESLNKREVSPELIAEGLELYREKVNELVMRALLKHLEAVSYRAFRVGSSAIAKNSHVKGGHEIKSDHNFKPWEKEQYGWDKLCAENNICSDLIVNGAEYISGIVVVSHHKEIGTHPDDDTHTTAGLHSCKNCRNLFRELIEQGIMSEDTMIRFVDDGPLIYEDKEDTDPYVIENGKKYIVEWPKLKLRKEITHEDVEKLPYEEMRMGAFLNLPKYSTDERKPGKSIPPYKIAAGR